MEPQALLDVATAAARRAATIHQQHLGRVRLEEWSEKTAFDFVSHVDIAAEAAITDTIRSAFPAHEILAEESATVEARQTARHAEWIWIVDPLDGTTNFLHGYPAFCASVAVAHRGQLIAGAVVSATDEWTAVLGGGAHHNGTRIAVSGIDSLRPALIGTGFPFKRHDLMPLYLRQFDAVTRATSGIRRAGSAALDLCYVASGNFDGFWELVLAPWDIAAGTLIVREAGGIVTDMNGDGDALLAGGAVLAGNPAMHAQLGDLLHQVRRQFEAEQR